MRKLPFFTALIAAACLLFGASAVNAQTNISVSAIGTMGPDHRLEVRFSDMHAHLAYDLNQLKLKDDAKMFESFIVHQNEKAVEVIVRHEDMQTQEVLDFFQSHVDEWAKHWHEDILNEPATPVDLDPDPDANSAQ